MGGWGDSYKSPPAQSYKSIHEIGGKAAPPDTKLEMALRAQPAAPSSGSSMSPIFGPAGTSGVIELTRADEADPPGESYDSEERAFWKRTTSVRDDRSCIARYSAQKRPRNAIGDIRSWVSANTLSRMTRVVFGPKRRNNGNGTFRAMLGARRTVLIEYLGAIY